MSTCHWKKKDVRPCSQDLGKQPETEAVETQEKFLPTQEFFIRINQTEAKTYQYSLLNSFKRNS